MFFDLEGMSGGHQIRTIHKTAAVFFVIWPIAFSLFDPKAALGFLEEAFRWSRDDLAWLQASASYYSGRKVQVPPQGYVNGDQRLWQLVVFVTGSVFIATGVLLWFFRLKMPLTLYQGILVTHATAFVIVSVMFLVHFYLTTLQPGFEESLSSMVDGKISPSFAREHYGKWYSGKPQQDSQMPNHPE